jgi:hypothetical protein
MKRVLNGMFVSVLGGVLLAGCGGSAKPAAAQKKSTIVSKADACGGQDQQAGWLFSGDDEANDNCPDICDNAGLNGGTWNGNWTNKQDLGTAVCNCDLTPEDVPAEMHITVNSEAPAICNQTCDDADATWNGQWNTPADEQSVCGCC